MTEPYNANVTEETTEPKAPFPQAAVGAPRSSGYGAIAPDPTFSEFQQPPGYARTPLVSHEDVTSTGLDEGLEAAATYVFWWISAIFFILIEKNSSYVIFHAWQSLFTFVMIFIVVIIFSWVQVFAIILAVCGYGFCIFMMYKAYTGAETGDRFKLPYIGKVAQQQAEKKLKIELYFLF